ncbi:MAG: hypothetical protein GY810_22825 [Aureispira sp.]|nr:hypothetical protein [Aureispira sp.]
MSLLLFESTLEVAIVILVVLILISFVLYAITTTKVTNQKQLSQNFKKLAGLLGVEVSLPKRNSSVEYPSLKGSWKGRSLHCHMERINAADRGQTYTNLELDIANPQGKTLLIGYEDFMAKIGKLFSGQDIQTGNKNLDKQFIFQSNDEAFAKTILDADLQKMLIQEAQILRGRLVLEDSKLIWNAVFEISSEEEVQDFEKMLNLCELLISKIEAYASA